MGGKTSKTAMSLSAREVIARRHPNSNPATEATVPREPAKVSDLGSSSLPSPHVLGKFDIDPEMLSKVAKGFNIKTTPIKTPTLVNSNMEHSAAAIRLKNEKDAAKELNPSKNVKFTEDEIYELLKKYRSMEKDPETSSILAKEANLPDDVASNVFRYVKYPIIEMERESEQDEKGYQAAR